MKNLLLITFILILFPACKTSVYTVHSDDGAEKGIPFLTKTIELEQQSIYAFPYYDVELEIVPLKNDSLIPGKKPVKLQKIRTTSSNNSILNRLQSELKYSASVNWKELDELIELYLKLPQVKEDSFSAIPVTNMVKRNVVVDKKMYFLNVEKSPFDSSSLNFELNGDNTLTKGEVSVSSDYSVITDILSTVVPISDLISSVFQLSEEAEAESTETKIAIENLIHKNIPLIDFESDSGKLEGLSYELLLKVTGGAYQYTFSKPVESYIAAETIIPFSTIKGFFIKKEIKQLSTKKETKEVKEENAVKINGSIVFPDKVKED
ncbi:MAG: hypothetical protein ABJH08_09705 [Balneola sp.]